jgi:hypothetical protein
MRSALRPALAPQAAAHHCYSECRAGCPQVLERRNLFDEVLR